MPKETVIAAFGSTFYHQAASGFLLSQNGTKFGSVPTFTAATPGRSITSIGYINSYFNPGTTITLTSTPLP